MMITHKSNTMDKIEYYENEHDEDARKTGWYINTYDKLNERPIDSVGPYATKTEALRMWRDTTPGQKEPFDAGQNEDV